MKHTVGDGTPHAVETIQQFAVVVILVPKIEDCQNDQRGHEYSHLTPPSPSTPQNIDIAKLFLDLLNPPRAQGMNGSLPRAHHCRPSSTRHRHDRDRQSVVRTIIEFLNFLVKNPDQFRARLLF
jgi:hypothetical protein